MKIVRTLLLATLFLPMLALAKPEKQPSTFDQLAQTPPMGWNSWNKFGCNVSDSLIRQMADNMVASGMKDAGYEYVVIDDCWQVSRDADGNIVPDEKRFPQGMKALADYIHGLGLKFGIYSCAGSRTCQGRPGSRGYQFQDARQYAKWGVDYLKYDWCSSEEQSAKAAYMTMTDAIKASGRPIVLSICEWGENKPWEWGKGVGQLWRISPDIRDCFDCEFNWGGVGVLQILDIATKITQYAGPGHWNDLEMLEIGNGGQSTEEYQSHFAIWCMLSAPLMAGNDLSKMDETIRKIQCNKGAIAIDQDSLGIPAINYLTVNDIEILVKPLANGDAAVLFLNRSNLKTALKFDWAKNPVYDDRFDKGAFRMGNNYQIRDIWEGKNVGKTDKPMNLTLEPHEGWFVRLSK